MGAFVKGGSINYKRRENLLRIRTSRNHLLILPCLAFLIQKKGSLDYRRREGKGEGERE